MWASRRVRGTAPRLTPEPEDSFPVVKPLSSLAILLCPCLVDPTHYLLGPLVYLNRFFKMRSFWAPTQTGCTAPVQARRGTAERSLSGSVECRSRDVGEVCGAQLHWRAVRLHRELKAACGTERMI